MGIIRQHKTTSLFVCFLIIAGICNLIGRTTIRWFDTLMFCANFMIYIGLIRFWAQTVRARILPTKARSYILTSSFFMIVYILQRVFKYRLVVHSVIMLRYVVYLYYIPLVMMPALLLATAIDLSYGNTKTGKIFEKVTIALGGAVSLIAITNDLHFLVYRPKTDLSVFDVSNGSYTWGAGFYVIYAWMILALAAGAVLLFRIAGRKGKKAVSILALAVAIWIVVLLIHALVFERFSIPRPFLKPEIDCFCMLLFFEVCIRSRLIPYNENYKGFVSKMKVPLLITDSDLHSIHTSDESLKVSLDDLEKSIKGPCYPDKDKRLCSMKIRAGYAFWIENEHELREQRQKLAKANEILSEENDLIAVENKLKEQKAHLDAQDLVYERITKAIFPKQKKIEEYLENVDPDSDGFPAALGNVCVLNAYSKRKTNLMLLSEDSLPESNRELFLALAESCRFLKCLVDHLPQDKQDHPLLRYMMLYKVDQMQR